MYKSLYFISLSKTSSSRMVTACLRGPKPPTASREGPGGQLGAVAAEARGEGSTVWQGPGRGEGVPLHPPVGVRAAAPGMCPGRLPRDPFPGPGDLCVQHRVGGS